MSNELMGVAIDQICDSLPRFGGNMWQHNISTPAFKTLNVIVSQSPQANVWPKPHLVRQTVDLVEERVLVDIDQQAAKASDAKIASPKWAFGIDPLIVIEHHAFFMKPCCICDPGPSCSQSDNENHCFKSSNRWQVTAPARHRDLATPRGLWARCRTNPALASTVAPPWSPTAWRRSRTEKDVVFARSYLMKWAPTE